MTEQIQPIANERRGWLIVIVAAVMAGMSYGSLLTVTVFLTPLEAEFGWLRGETSFAYMAGNMMAGLGGVATGFWADRISTRSIVLIGAIMLGAAYVLLGIMQSLVEFYIFYGVLLGGLGVSAFLAPLTTSIGFWFDKNRGLAISVMLVGQSLGSAGMPLLAGYIMAASNWRDAYLTLALIVWVCLLPLCFLLRDPPGLREHKAAARAQSVSAEGGPTIISPWALTITLCFASMGIGSTQTIPLIHLVPLLREIGFDAQTANTVFGTMIGASIAGRLVFGRLADKIGGLPTLMVAHLLSSVVLFPFTQTGSLAALYGIAVVFGFGFGGVLPSLPVIIRELVPAHLVGRTWGIVLLTGYMALGFGGYFVGWIYDLTGSYSVGFALGTGTGLYGFLVVLGLYLRIRRRKAGETAAQAA